MFLKPWLSAVYMLPLNCYFLLSFWLTYSFLPKPVSFQWIVVFVDMFAFDSIFSLLGLRGQLSILNSRKTQVWKNSFPKNSEVPPSPSPKPLSFRKIFVFPKNFELQESISLPQMFNFRKVCLLFGTKLGLVSVSACFFLCLSPSMSWSTVANII